MQKYFYLFFLPFIFSCKTKIFFVGNAQPPTEKIDIWIDSTQIHKNYFILGYAGIDKYGFTSSVEKQTKKYIAKAKKCGADAILFSNYAYTQYGTFINNSTIQKIDTIQNVNTINNNTSITTNPTIYGQKVYFIKYK